MENYLTYIEYHKNHRNFDINLCFLRVKFPTSALWSFSPPLSPKSSTLQKMILKSTIADSHIQPEETSRWKIDSIQITRDSFGIFGIFLVPDSSEVDGKNDLA